MQLSEVTGGRDRGLSFDNQERWVETDRYLQGPLKTPSATDPLTSKHFPGPTFDNHPLANWVLRIARLRRRRGQTVVDRALCRDSQNKFHGS